MIRLLAVPLLLLLALLPATHASAQCPRDLVEEGVRAYRQLQLDEAVDLFERALESEREGEPCPDRARTIFFLGASEFFRGDRQAAVAAFRRVVAFEPRFRPDELVFPPEVTDLFEEVRRTTPAATATLPSDLRIRAGQETVPIRLYASAPHTVRVLVTAGDGAPLRDVFRGRVVDSLYVGWDGTDWDGRPVADGDYQLRVISLTETGAASGRVIIPLEVDQVRTPEQAFEADARPGGTGSVDPGEGEEEGDVQGRRSVGRAVGSLSVGVLAGTAIALLPRMVGTSSIHGDGRAGGTGRVLLAGAAVVAGLVGFADQIMAMPEPAGPLLRIRSGEPEARVPSLATGDGS